MFRNATDSSCKHEVEINDVLEAIGLGRWKDQVEAVRGEKLKEDRDNLKKKLPCVTFSGTFNEFRREYLIKEYTGFFVADIDKITKERLSKLRKELLTDAYVYSYFNSPSKGLKVLIRVNGSAGEHKSKTFPSIRNYFKLCYDIDIDSSGKDLTRLCFVSFDEEIHYNCDSITFNINDPRFAEREMVRVYKESTLSEDAITNEDQLYKIVKGGLNKNGDHYNKGNRHMYLFKAACSLNRLGVSGESIRRILCHHHSISKDMYVELESIIKSIDKMYKHEFNTRTLTNRKWVKEVNLLVSDQTDQH